MADAYHAHLDVCRQCRESPFGLCPFGQVALEQSVAGKDRHRAPLAPQPDLDAASARIAELEATLRLIATLTKAPDVRLALDEWNAATVGESLASAIVWARDALAKGHP